MTTSDNTQPERDSESASEFEQMDQPQTMSLAGEFWLFICEEKKWWLMPIILVLLVVGIAAALTTTGAAPFIYTLF
jgi:Family of unknown function (DUF5989)